MISPSAVSVPADHGLRRAAIVQSLLSDVFAGNLAAGQRLVTQDLAERFGVSHTPIREALISLAGIGIVDHLPNKGAIVRCVTAKDVREISQVRRALECEATRLACGRIGLNELDELAKDIRKLKSTRAMSSARFIDHARATDTRLHDLIANSCDNAFLAKELNRLKVLFRAFRDVAWARETARNDFRRLAMEADEHLAIIQALLADDRREAARAMARHIRAGVKYWTRALPEQVEGNGNGKKMVSGNGRVNGKPKRSQ